MPWCPIAPKDILSTTVLSPCISVTQLTASPPRIHTSTVVDCHSVTDPNGSTNDASVVEANLLDTCWLQPKVGIHRVAKDMTCIVTTSPHFFAGEEYCVPISAMCRENLSFLKSLCWQGLQCITVISITQSQLPKNSFFSPGMVLTLRNSVYLMLKTKTLIETLIGWVQ